MMAAVTVATWPSVRSWSRASVTTAQHLRVACSALRPSAEAAAQLLLLPKATVERSPRRSTSSATRPSQPRAWWRTAVRLRGTSCWRSRCLSRRTRNWRCDWSSCRGDLVSKRTFCSRRPSFHCCRWSSPSVGKCDWRCSSQSHRLLLALVIRLRGSSSH